jgi:hypothetical protein
MHQHQWQQKMMVNIKDTSAVLYNFHCMKHYYNIREQIFQFTRLAVGIKTSIQLSSGQLNYFARYFY